MTFLKNPPSILAFFLILITFCTNSVYADDMKIDETCTQDGWMVTITDTEGNPMENVRVGTLDKISSSSPEESFYTDQNGQVIVPPASITSFVMVSKAGFNDQKISIDCDSIGFLTYQNSLEGFTIQYPSNWNKQTPNDPFVTIVFLSPAESESDVFSENVLVGTEILPPNTNLPDYTKSITSNLSGSTIDVLESRSTELSGYPAYKYFIINKVENVQMLAVWTVVDSKGYFVTFTAMPETFSKYEKTFDKILDSFRITSGDAPAKTQFVPDLVAGKYTDAEAGLEIEFPPGWAGFSLEIPENGDASTMGLPPELEKLADIYSGMKMVMVLPSQTSQAENFPGMMTMTTMDVSAVETYSNLISDTLTDVASQSIGENIPNQNPLASQPECDLSSPQQIVLLNGIKSHQITMSCDGMPQDKSATTSIYTFLTKEKVISAMYTAIHDSSKPADLSEFEDSIKTINVQDPVDFSQPSAYAKIFGLSWSTENVNSNGKNYEFEFVSDSELTDFSYNEQSNSISFKPLETNGLANSDIYLNDLFEPPYSVEIDGKTIDEFFVIEDTTTGKDSISLTYQLPVKEIKISGKAPSASKIPDWIRNNAEWWAQDAIGDSDFVSGIQYLIKEEIMTIPETAKGESSGAKEIPSWIKNNADWWAQGLISDDDFVKGIQFLIENGIMEI